MPRRPELIAKYEKQYQKAVLQRRRRAITAEEYQARTQAIYRRQEEHDAQVQLRQEERALVLQLLREAREEEKARDKEIKRIEKEIKKKNFASITLNLLDTDRIVGFRRLMELLSRSTKNLMVRIGNQTWIINDRTRHRLLRVIEDEVVETRELYEDSWGAYVVVARQDVGTTITISKVPDINNYTYTAGAFFKYTHRTIFDFRRYGIYKTGETQDHSDTCLINALRNGGLEEEKIEKIKIHIKNRIIPRCKLKEIADMLKITIILRSSTNHHTKATFGTGEKIFSIGIHDEHYFIIEPVEMTSYSLLHYDEVKDEKNFHQIIGKKSNGIFMRDAKRYISSFDAINCLLENKSLLKEISMEDRIIASTQFYDSISTDIKCLDYDAEACIRPILHKKPNKKKIHYENLFFDFETYLKDGIHIPYLARTYNDKTNAVFYGADCGKQLLDSLKKNTRLIAHNANYDYRFIIHYLHNIHELARGNRLIGLSAKYYYNETKFLNIEVKDSYHLISKKLADFPKSFGLDAIKEVMPYDLYNEQTIEQRFIDIDYVLENFIAEKDKEQFLNNIQRWNLAKGTSYDIIEYSSRYCELDCIILSKGYNIFRKMMLECVQLDIDGILTIASLAHQYFINQGCYEGVNQLGGVPQLFIQATVVGGRTMTANNQKIVMNEKINDFDAVSLYPSAMARIPGFLMGVPKVITNTSYDDLQKKDGYFVDILIKSVGIHRAFSLMSYKTAEGIRHFTNDMIGKTMRVDKTTLEDLIEFHQITFDIVRGYYFDEGFNTKIKQTIEYVFAERIKQKKLDNPSQEIYKLIMNSGYGKSIMKPVEEDTRFFDDEKEADVFISRQYNWITKFVKFGSKTKVYRVKPLVEHFNICQVGTTILSMSKRIMNEVMCLAEDKGLELYYQDTDSIHIKDKDIDTLATAFSEKYDKVLIGKGMGQFHSDFEIKGCTNIFARRSIFLGKKSYIDELEGTNEKGEQVIDYHIRMKGIPESCLLHTCIKNGFKNVFEMYEALFTGKAIEVDLTNDGRKANFKMNNDYSVHTLSLFKRTMAF
jgi:hypothetical protein